MTIRCDVDGPVVPATSRIVVTADNDEGFSAFVEQPEPQFRGR